MVAPSRCLIHRTVSLNFIDLVTEVIDLRSFSNLWYWIVLAVMWSTVSHYVLGVPFHIVLRARRGDVESQQDMETLTRMNVRRLLRATDQAGVPATALGAFVLTGLVTLGWGYGVEFCQAVFFLVLPMMIIGGITIWTARRIEAHGFEDIARMLRNHRILIQACGVVFIFVTAFWGMYTNVTVSPFR